MKAAVIRSFSELEVAELSEPKLGDYDAKCELLFGATCTGTDSHIIAGQFPWIGKLPTVLGHESVGRVVEVGSKVRHFRIGDLVTRVGTPAVDGVSVTWGGFAQTGIAKDHWAMAADGLPADQWGSYRVNQVVPAGIALEAAPMFITWRETLSYLKRLGFTSGHSVLVIGSGGNGLSFAAHAANLKGYNIAMVGNPRHADTAKAVGVEHFFDYRQGKLADTIGRSVMSGFDFIIDTVGRTGSVEPVLRCLKHDGLVAIYGLDDFAKVQINPANARGRFRIQYGGDYDEAETHQAVCDFVRTGKLDASLWYDAARPYPLAKIADAYRELQVRKLATPKALIRLGGE